MAELARHLAHLASRPRTSLKFATVHAWRSLSIIHPAPPAPDRDRVNGRGDGATPTTPLPGLGGASGGRRPSSDARRRRAATSAGLAAPGSGLSDTRRDRAGEGEADTAL